MSNNQFPDLANHWAKDFIQGLRSRGIVSGFPDGSFRQNKEMSRAEYAAILNKAFDLPPIRPYEAFVDFSPHYWAAGAIQKAYEAGFLSGFPNRQFRPLDLVTRVQVLVSLTNGLKIAEVLEAGKNAKPLAEIYDDAADIPNYARDEIEVATRAGLVANYPNLKRLNPNQAATRAEVAAFIYQALVFLGRVPAIESEFILILPSTLLRQGTSSIVNGRTRSARWGQWRVGASLRTGMRDCDLQNLVGIELLNSSDATKQPVAWFSSPIAPFATRWEGSDRFLDITDLTFTANWNLQVNNATLSLTTPESKLVNITFQEQSSGATLTLELTRGTSWQLQQRDREWILTLDAPADPALLARFQSAANANNNTSTDQRDEGETGSSTEKPKPPLAESKDKQTSLTGNLPDGLGIKVSTRSNSLILELRPDALVNRDILWMAGLRWQQSYLSLGRDRFPVTWLTCDCRANPRLLFRPIWTEAASMKGTEPLLNMAQKWDVVAAINGGFFNRQTLLPLGAIRFAGQWRSGPILNRGAIAWNESGEILLDRLALNETLTNQYGKTFPILFLNSGYYRAGISRYTPAWGSSYTSFIDDEVIVVVENNRVIRHVNGGAAGTTAVPIPQNGYILTLRANASVSAALDVGTTVSINSATVPPQWNDYPNILAAGPLLLKQGRNMLDVAAEGFDSFFAQQTAIRSIVGITATGELILAAIHNRVGGRGPTLPETVQAIQQLGIVDALNLDGGSSTSLYLGGQLLNRPPSSAARVHNGFAIALS